MAELLFDRARCFLAVIDVQDVFLNKLEAAEAQALVSRVIWLIGVARALDIPILAMAEDIASNGGPTAPISAALPPGTPVHDKHVFGLAGQGDILAAAHTLGRDQAVLVGLETDVCVAQSALGLLAEGIRVAVVADATGSPCAAHAAGLARMTAAGVVPTSAKGIFYEWMRDLPTLSHYRSLKAAAAAAGIAL